MGEVSEKLIDIYQTMVNLLFYQQKPEEAVKYMQLKADLA